jgi:hypothetical protein
MLIYIYPHHGEIPTFSLAMAAVWPRSTHTGMDTSAMGNSYGSDVDVFLELMIGENGIPYGPGLRYPDTPQQIWWGIQSPFTTHQPTGLCMFKWIQMEQSSNFLSQYKQTYNGAVMQS